LWILLEVFVGLIGLDDACWRGIVSEALLRISIRRLKELCAFLVRMRCSVFAARSLKMASNARYSAFLRVFLLSQCVGVSVTARGVRDFLQAYCIKKRTRLSSGAFK
jgi:hypothetical protein